MAEAVINHGAFVWSITELLRGDYKQSEYQKVILPLVAIRRLDTALEPTKDAVLEKREQSKNEVDNVEPILEQISGEHFTPREVIELMVNTLFVEDDESLAKPRIVRTARDRAAGTCGMLATAKKHLKSMNPNAALEVFDQELNTDTYAVCRSDMMLKGQNAERRSPRRQTPAGPVTELR